MFWTKLHELPAGRLGVYRKILDKRLDHLSDTFKLVSFRSWWWRGPYSEAVTKCYESHWDVKRLHSAVHRHETSCETQSTHYCWWKMLCFLRLVNTGTKNVQNYALRCKGQNWLLRLLQHCKERLASVKHWKWKSWLPIWSFWTPLQPHSKGAWYLQTISYIFCGYNEWEPSSSIVSLCWECTSF